MSIPNHVAIIPDGNRRAARARGLASHALYTARHEHISEMFSWLQEIGVEHLSAFAISADNVRNRGKIEVITACEAIHQLCESIGAMPGFALHLFGDIQGLPAWIPTRNTFLALQAAGSAPDAFTVHLGINYSGDQDIRTEPDAEPALSAGVPHVDLLVRTGGQQRLSGFLPHQTQYAELYFEDLLWPEFGKPEFEKALEWFAQQKRNFGK